MWRLVQAGFRERRKMLHNVLARQLPVDAGARRRCPGRRRHRPRTADRRPSPSGSGWRCSRRIGPIGSDRPASAGCDRRPIDAADPVVRLAPAKLNLTLAVVGRRPDGFHDLHSVFVPLGLADRLSLAVGDARGHAPRRRAGHRTARGQPRPARHRRRPGRGRRGPRATGHAPARGPARQAHPGRGRPGRRIVGRARPPSTRRSRRGAPGRRRRRRAGGPRAATIGSDVPFFAAGGPALIEGRGERVTPLHGIHGHHGVLLVTPALAVRTPDVFAVFDGLRGGGPGDGSVRMTSEHLAQELGNGLSAADLRRPGRGPGRGQRPAAGGGRRRRHPGPQRLSTEGWLRRRWGCGRRGRRCRGRGRASPRACSRRRCA